MKDELVALVEWLRGRVRIETSCGNRTENPNNHVRLMDEAADLIEQQASTIERMGWRDIESAPDCEDGILVCDATKPHPAVGVARFIDGRWRGYDHGMGVEAFWPTPTHWMPLPEPPALTNKEPTK